MKPEWYPDWSGQTAILVASGPSAKDIPLDLAKGKARVITINNSWMLAPWADQLHACDFSWWERFEGVPEFTGLKTCSEYRCTHRPEWGVHFIQVTKGDDRINFTEMGKVGWGGNSGFHALNMAIQFGAKRILLVGYDMTITYGIHWHGPHPSGHNPRNTTIQRWRRAFEAAAKSIKARGVEVINCSHISTLTQYPKMSFEDALYENH